jgi:Tfp pilus assembly protein PilO
MIRKLSKEKRQQLILVVLGTVLVVSGLWFGLIHTQQGKLKQIAQKKIEEQKKLDQVRKAIQSADQVEQQLCEARKILDKDEESMATGDLYSWTITTLRTFKLGYKIDIPQFSQIDGPKNMTLLPDFPYKQASVTIAGTGTFHEFGRFVSDFENQFPFMRILNVTLEPVSALVGSGSEKLSFKMEIAALVKPGAS